MKRHTYAVVLFSLITIALSGCGNPITAIKEDEHELNLKVHEILAEVKGVESADAAVAKLEALVPEFEAIESRSEKLKGKVSEKAAIEALKSDAFKESSASGTKVFAEAVRISKTLPAAWKVIRKPLRSLGKSVFLMDDSLSELCKEKHEPMEKVVAALASVRDEKSAKDAAKSIEAVSSKFQNFQERLKYVDTSSRGHIDVITYDKMRESLVAEAERIQARHPELWKYLREPLKKIGEYP